MASPYDNKEFTRQIFGSYPLDDVIKWIAVNMEPEEIFSSDHLSQWAEKNGYEENKKK